MKFKFFVLFILFLSVFSLQAQENIAITLKGAVTVSKEKIYLGDVAEISGQNAAQVEQLKVLYLKRAALPGYKISVTKESIYNRIRKNYPDANIAGPDRAVVTTRKSTVLREELISFAEKYVKENMHWKPEDVTISVRSAKSEVPVIEGDVLLKVKEDYSSALKGSVVIPIEIYVDSKFYKIEPVSLIVNVTSDCFMTERAVNKGEQLTEADVRKIRKDITNLPFDLITDINALSGKVVKRSIIRGTLLTGAMFERKPLFRRGSPVKVVLKIKSMSIEISATAEDAGAEGDTVKVKLVTGKILEGIVDSAGQVIIQK